MPLIPFIVSKFSACYQGQIKLLIKLGMAREMGLFQAFIPHKYSDNSGNDELVGAGLVTGTFHLLPVEEGTFSPADNNFQLFYCTM